MLGTSDTTSDTEAIHEHERLANFAVALHILQYSLDMPSGQTFDRYGSRAGSITISVNGHSAEAWLDSLIVQDRTEKRVEKLHIFPKPMLLHDVACLLPGLGIRVRIRYFGVIEATATTHCLQAVSS